jgi:DNA-binding response OmpR family regulator
MAAAAQIMIVEDSDTQAMQLQFLLEEEGWDVVRTATAEAALEELNRHLPALILVDYHLPGMRGNELCRRIRMNVDARSIPILMLTVEDAAGSEQAGLESGADDYVSKTVNPEILMLRVRTLLRTAGARTAILSQQEAPFRRARLLAIDDSPTYLEALSTALRGEGYEVTQVPSGKDGLDRLAQESFDCVIVDLVMPEIDGIEVCRRVCRMSHLLEQPMVIILTARETRDEMTRGLEAGADDFVGKSSDVTVLKARVRALLRRKSFQEENRRIREQLLRKEMEAAEARAAHELAEARASLAERLERTNKELEAFSYSVSHDLRAPLRSIDGFSKLLFEDYADQLDEKAQHYLHRVREAAQRMGHLIDDLLQLSRVGRSDLRRKPVDLAGVARAVMADLIHAHRGANPEALRQVIIPEEVPADCDPRLLRIVLENLLGNAWKFTWQTVEPVIEFGFTPGDADMIYFVKDNGAGFSMDYADKLFTPFQRLHKESHFPGTGIGLATVQRIVDRHGGRVWAEAEVDRVATFFFTLPPVGTGA